MMPGSTSTAPSGCSLASRRGPHTSPPALNEHGLSPRTATSGSTSRTTAASLSSAIRSVWSRPSPRRRPICPSPEESRPSWGFMGPEGSRRARALTIWATLRAYGRSGLPHDGRASPRARSAARRARRCGTGAGAARRGAAEHRVLPMAARRCDRGLSSTSSTAASGRRCYGTDGYSRARPCSRARSPFVPR